MIAAFLFGILLALFLLVEAFDITLLKEPSFWLEHAGVLAGFAGVCSLVADVALPVPSILVMIAHGALFGVAIGTLLSLVGSTGAALAGFAIGRRSGPLLARLVPVEELVLANRLLIRWGMLAIVVTRPGSLPGALLYALTGAGAARFQNGALVFGLVLLVASSFWLVGRWLEPRLVRPESDRT
jgi:uncharacterized membrane protein YdjX (TVP38/TMEM64 family)